MKKFLVLLALVLITVTLHTQSTVVVVPTVPPNTVFFKAQIIAPYQTKPGVMTPLVFISTHAALFIRAINADTDEHIGSYWFIAMPNKIYWVKMPPNVKGVRWEVWTAFGTLKATTLPDWRYF